MPYRAANLFAHPKEAALHAPLLVWFLFLLASGPLVPKDHLQYRFEICGG